MRHRWQTTHHPAATGAAARTPARSNPPDPPTAALERLLRLVQHFLVALLDVRHELRHLQGWEVEGFEPSGACWRSQHRQRRRGGQAAQHLPAPLLLLLLLLRGGQMLCVLPTLLLPPLLLLLRPAVGGSPLGAAPDRGVADLHHGHQYGDRGIKPDLKTD